MSFDQQTSIASLQQSGQLLGQPLKTTDAWFSLSQKLEGDWPAWRGESLTRELLESVGQSWSSLDVNLKAKLLMALVALKKSVATQLEDQIRNLFDLALQDQADWVRVIAKLFSRFLEGQVDLDEYQHSHAQLADTIKHLRGVLNDVDLAMVPKERAYLQSAREQSMQPPQKQHFTLKGSARASKKIALASATKVSNFATKMQSNQANNNSATNNSNAPTNRPLALRTGADGRFHAGSQANATRIENASKKDVEAMDVEKAPPARLGNNKPVPPAKTSTVITNAPSASQKASVGQSLFNRTKKRERPVQSLGLSSSGPLPHSTPSSLSASSGAHSSLGASGTHGGGQTAFIEYFEPKKEVKPAKDDSEKAETTPKRRKQTKEPIEKKPAKPTANTAPLRASGSPMPQPLVAPYPYMTSPYAYQAQPSPQGQAVTPQQTTGTATAPQPFPSYAYPQHLFSQPNPTLPNATLPNPNPSDTGKPSPAPSQGPSPSSLQQLQALMMVRGSQPAPSNPVPPVPNVLSTGPVTTPPNPSASTGPSHPPQLSAVPSNTNAGALQSMLLPLPLGSQQQQQPLPSSHSGASPAPPPSLANSHQHMMLIIQQQQQMMQQQLQAQSRPAQSQLPPSLTAQQPAPNPTPPTPQQQALPGFPSLLFPSSSMQQTPQQQQELLRQRLQQPSHVQPVPPMTGALPQALPFNQFGAQPGPGGGAIGPLTMAGMNAPTPNNLNYTANAPNQAGGNSSLLAQRLSAQLLDK